MRNLLFVLLLAAGSVMAKDIAFDKPLMYLTDCAGNEISGTRSTAFEYLMEKVLKQPAGEYCGIRPPVKFTVTGDAAPPDPDPEPDPDPDPDPVDPDTPAPMIACSEPVVWGSGRTFYRCTIQLDETLTNCPRAEEFGYLQGKTHHERLAVFLHPWAVGDQYLTGSYDAGDGYTELHMFEESSRGCGSSSKWVLSGGENHNGRKLEAALAYILDNHPEIDLDQGIYTYGKSLGGTGVLHQPFFMGTYGKHIAVADSYYGHTMAPVVEPPGMLKNWTSEQLVRGDLTKSPEAFENIHLSWRGGSNDGVTFTMKLWETCEAHKLSCSGHWHNNGHALVESGYAYPDWQPRPRLDRPLPVITNNTSNHHELPRGWHNKGVRWDQAGIVDTASQLSVPLEYRAFDSPGEGLPASPASVSFSVTVRRVRNFDTSGALRWEFGDQAGEVPAGGGLLTIDGLTLQDDQAATLIVKKSEAPADPVGAEFVYTRVPRTQGCHQLVHALNGSTRELCHADIWDWLPDVVRDVGNFIGPGQLVHRKDDGAEVVLFDCVTTDDPCVPMDPMFSPDGRKLAFSVYWSNNLETLKVGQWQFPQRVLDDEATNWAQVHIIDLETGAHTSWPKQAGVVDTSPVWLGDGRLAFTTNQEGYKRPRIRTGVSNPTPEQRLFIANQDGTGRQDIGQHDVSGALHPYALMDGRICYSLHMGSHNLPHGGTNGGINTTGTIDNNWAIACTDSAGGDFQVSFGIHAKKLGTKTVKALHFLGQRMNGDLCSADYYRGGNFGLGDVACWPVQPAGVEGDPPDFLPAGLYDVAPWSTSEDHSGLSVRRQKIGYPDGMPDGQLLLTFGRGVCTQVGNALTGLPALADEYGVPGCDTGIYATTQIPSQSAADLAKIVDSPDWQEFGARVRKVRPIAHQPLQQTGDGTCQMLVANAHDTDALNYRPYVFNRRYYATAGDGGQLYGVDPESVTALRFWEQVPSMPGDTHPGTGYSTIGNRLKLLGDAPLEADGSARVSLPCDTALVMGGVNAAGLLVKRDQLPQSLRPGELRTCTGCHLHGSTGRAPASTLAWNSAPETLLEASPAPTFQDDVQPVLEAACGECHHQDGVTPNLSDYMALVWDFKQASIPAALQVPVDRGFQRPHTSKYIHSMYAAASPLYWYAAAERTDGKADGDYADDVDCSACGQHIPLPAPQLRILADWIDAGAVRF